jgi:peptide/nickel transport system permease protein
VTTIESMPANAPALPQDATVRRPKRASIRRFATPRVVIPALVVALWLVVVMFAPLIAPYGPTEQTSGRLEAPSLAHLFGTDALGRDVFSRVLYGAQLSIPVAALTIVLAVIVGGLIGAIAGYFGGWLDSILMRVGDITLAFPSMLLAMAVAAALGPGLTNAFIAIVIVWWPIYARLVRGQILSIKEREHVLAARAIGMGRLKILRKHILPHAATPVIVSATMDLGMIIILVASLSFLGLGAAPPSAEWGAMITDGAANFYQWWIAAGPGLAMVSIVLAVNFLGDSLRDVLNVREVR